MRLFIAENPKLGRSIAEAIQGTQEKKQGYIIKGDSIITWAFGHILKLAEYGDWGNPNQNTNECPNTTYAKVFCSGGERGEITNSLLICGLLHFVCNDNALPLIQSFIGNSLLQCEIYFLILEGQNNYVG